MDDGLYRFIAFAGFLIVGCIAWLTGKRVSVDWKTIGGSFILAWVLAGTFTPTARTFEGCVLNLLWKSHFLPLSRPLWSTPYWVCDRTLI